MAKTANEYRFKVNRKGARRLWRLIALRGDQTLHDLHGAIFSAFGRDDEHLYSFYFPRAPGRRRSSGPPPKVYSSPLQFEGSDARRAGEERNAARMRLDALHLQTAQTFEYLFDFGDAWWHEVVVAQIGPVAPGQRYPWIVDQRGESPPQYEIEEE